MWLEIITRESDIDWSIRVGRFEEKTFEQRHEELAKTEECCPVDDRRLTFGIQKPLEI